MAKSLCRALVTSVSVILTSFLFVGFIINLGVQEQTVTWVVVVLGTTLIAIFCYLVIYLKTPISNSLQMRDEDYESNWIKDQLAAYWHVPALLYLLFAWFI